MLVLSALRAGLRIHRETIQSFGTVSCIVRVLTRSTWIIFPLRAEAND